MRAISEALGADLKVEGKTINITTEVGDINVPSDLNSESSNDISVLKLEREKIASEIIKHENAIKNYEEKYIPSTERAIKTVKAPITKQEYMDQLEKETAEFETLKSEACRFAETAHRT
ncbi:hypothetical protein D3C74_241480 [compost metagenome]